MAAWVAMFLPWVEIAAGGGLVLRRFYPGSLVTILGLLLFFLAAISISWARGLDISCGCFGEQTEGVSYPQLIIRDLGMIAMAVFLLARESQALPTDSRTMAPR
ncbi:MAG: MauE/DoxX family redox-associated membrane protein [Verrucomicrobiales bacterium]